MTDMAPIIVPSDDRPVVQDGAGCGFGRQPPASSLRAAESVRDGLRAKLDDAKVALALVDDRRRDISFSAHVQGGEHRETLNKLNKDRGVKVAEIESLEVAIVEAGRRVADAQRDEELAADGVKAT